MADPSHREPRVPRRTKVLAANLATATVLLAIATVYPDWQFWVGLVAVMAVVGELISWRRARRSDDDAWRPLEPSVPPAE